MTPGSMNIQIVSVLSIAWLPVLTLMAENGEII